MYKPFQLRECYVPYFSYHISKFTIFISRGTIDKHWTMCWQVKQRSEMSLTKSYSSIEVVNKTCKIENFYIRKHRKRPKTCGQFKVSMHTHHLIRSIPLWWEKKTQRSCHRHHLVSASVLTKFASTGANSLRPAEHWRNRCVTRCLVYVTHCSIPKKCCCW